MAKLRVLVSDTSVLIDLERGDLLEAAFALPVQFAVPDLLYKQEMAAYNGPTLLDLGLQVLTLDPDGVAKAQDYHRRTPGLSVPDSFALALAWDQECTLLSGDGLLRRLAESERITCHGVLWITDQINMLATVAPEILCRGLRQISEHPRCRLPKREVTLRLKHYASGSVDKT